MPMLCLGCREKERYFDRKLFRYSDYCSKFCRDTHRAAKGGKSSQANYKMQALPARGIVPGLPLDGHNTKAPACHNFRESKKIKGYCDRCNRTYKDHLGISEHVLKAEQDRTLTVSHYNPLYSTVAAASVAGGNRHHGQSHFHGTKLSHPADRFVPYNGHFCALIDCTKAAFHQSAFCSRSHLKTGTDPANFHLVRPECMTRGEDREMAIAIKRSHRAAQQEQNNFPTGNIPGSYQYQYNPQSQPQSGQPRLPTQPPLADPHQYPSYPTQQSMMPYDTPVARHDNPRHHGYEGARLASHHDQSNTIFFYEKHEPYYEFTNFYESPIVLKNTRWPTSEHFFQSQKFASNDKYLTLHEENVRRLPTPRDAFEYVRKNSWFVGSQEWEKKKNDVMYRAVKAKFTQNANLTILLLGTGDKQLVEHTSNDKYWGDGGDGTGLNQLGKILMKVRSEIRQEYGGTRHQPIFPSQTMAHSHSTSYDRDSQLTTQHQPTFSSQSTAHDYATSSNHHYQPATRHQPTAHQPMSDDRSTGYNQLIRNETTSQSEGATLSPSEARNQSATHHQATAQSQPMTNNHTANPNQNQAAALHQAATQSQPSTNDLSASYNHRSRDQPVTHQQLTTQPGTHQQLTTPSQANDPDRSTRHTRRNQNQAIAKSEQTALNPLQTKNLPKPQKQPSSSTTPSIQSSGSGSGADGSSFSRGGASNSNLHHYPAKCSSTERDPAAHTMNSPPAYPFNSKQRPTAQHSLSGVPKKTNESKKHCNPSPGKESQNESKMSHNPLPGTGKAGQSRKELLSRPWYENLDSKKDDSGSHKKPVNSHKTSSHSGNCRVSKISDALDQEPQTDRSYNAGKYGDTEGKLNKDFKTVPNEDVDMDPISPDSKHNLRCKFCGVYGNCHQPTSLQTCMYCGSQAIEFVRD